MIFCIALLSLIGQPGVPARAQAQPQRGLEAKSILILHSHEANVPVFLQTDKGLSTALESGGIPSINQFFESLDLRRNPGPEHRKLLVEQMRVRYGHRRLDMIITLYPEALEFVLKDCRDVLPDVPILALYLPQGIELPKADRRIIGHFPTLDMIGTLEIALRLVPGTKRVYVVGGGHEVDRRLEDQARRDFRKWEGALEFIYLSHLPLEDILAGVSNAPLGSIILFLAVTQDVTGRSQTTPEVARRLSQVSVAPIFGILEASLGHGIIGGSLFNFENIGTQAGKLVPEILRGGHSEENFPKSLNVACVPMFDWRELRRWNLSEAALPKGSIVINRESTFWDFRYYIIGILAFCLAESGLIVFFIVQRRRKKVAEESLRKAEEKYRNIFEGAVEGILETSPQGEPLTVNPALAKILGYGSPGEFISVIRDFGGQVYADPEKRRQLVDLLEKQDVVLGFECEFLRRDGEKIWVSINTRRSCGPDGKTLYYSGFIEDITERRQAREALRSSAAKYRQLYESMMDGYVLVGMDGLIKEYNEAYLQMTGYAPEELLRLTYRDLTPEKWHAFEQKIIEEQVLPRGYSEIYEKEYRKKDGAVFPVELRTVLLKDETGANSGMWAILRDITERKSASEALQISEERFRALAESSLVGIYILQDGKYVYVNPAMARVFGYTVAEMTGMTPREIVQPSDHGLVGNNIRSRITGEVQAMRYEVRGRYRDGSTVDVEVYGSRMVMNGRPALVGTLLDITERKRAEEGLRESEDRFRQVAESVGDFIWEVDATGLYRYTSPSVERILGYRPDELVGKKHFYDLFIPEVREELKAAALKAFAEKQPFRALPNPNMSKEGRVVHLETSGQPMLDANGNLVGYRGADTDATERKWSEEALAESRAQMLAIFNSTTDLIWSVDPETFGLVTFNTGLQDYFLKGLGIEIKAGMTPDDLLPPDFAVQWREFYARSLRDGAYVTEYSTAAGTHYLLLSINPLRRGENVFGISVFGKDITEKKRSEEELRKYRDHLEEMIRERTAELVVARDQAEAANRAKSVFLSNMSHELRTPLNSILGVAQLLGRDGEFPPKQRKLLDIIGQSGGHLLELINDVLEISKIEAGQLVAASAAFDLHRFLDDLERIMSHRAEQKGLQWSIDRDPGLPRWIESDERKLRQILINLVGNALKFTEKGHVTLRVRERKAEDALPGGEPTASLRLAFEIEDTGIGIAREDRERIFEPFVQAYQGATDAVEGTGLGLALSRSFVRLLGGDISVKSETGKGSTFLFAITAKRAECAECGSPADFRQVAGLAAGQSRYTLLVADDNSESRLIMRQLLEPVGFAIVEAMNGREAIEVFKGHRPHLIFMDLRMPVMDGYEAARRIREEEAKRQSDEGREAHTPVIAFTAHVMSSEGDQSVDPSLFDGFIRKPVNVRDLFSLLAEHLGVEYIYREASSPGAEPGGNGAAGSVTPEALSAVHTEWLNQFRMALRKGYPEEILNLVEQIRPENAALATGLEELVRVHGFDRLVSLTEQAVKEAANG